MASAPEADQAPVPAESAPDGGTGGASSGRSDLRGTLTHPATWIGFLATAMMAFSLLTPGFASKGTWDQIVAPALLRRILEFQVGRILITAGAVGLFWAWLRLRPGREPRIAHWLVLVVWSLPLLAAPPLFSSDPYLYADQAWIIHSGFDPYQVGLSEVGGPYAKSVHPVWRHTTGIYPPMALYLQFLIGTLTGFHGLATVIAMRLQAILGICIIAFCVPRIARLLHADARLASWFAVLNPLLVIHALGGMHNDVMMIAMVAVALWCVLRFPTWWGMAVAALVVGLAGSFKQPGMIAALAVGLLPVAAGLRSMRFVRRVLTMALWCAASCLLAGLSFAGISLAVGFEFLGWRHATKIGELTWGMSPASILEQIIGGSLNRLGVHVALMSPFSTMTTLLSGVVVALLAWRYFFADLLPVERCGRIGRWLASPRRWWAVGNRSAVATSLVGQDWSDHPVRWMVWSFTAVGLGGAGFHGWYFLWGGIYLGMLGYSNRTLRTLIGALIVAIVAEGGLEYFGLRPIPGYLVGIAIAWIFVANGTRMRLQTWRPNFPGATKRPADER